MCRSQYPTSRSSIRAPGTSSVCFASLRAHAMDESSDGDCCLCCSFKGFNPEQQHKANNIRHYLGDFLARCKDNREQPVYAPVRPRRLPSYPPRCLCVCVWSPCSAVALRIDPSLRCWIVHGRRVWRCSTNLFPCLRCCRIVELESWTSRASGH